MEIQDEWVCEDIWEDYDDEDMDVGGQLETAVDREAEESKGDSRTNSDTRGTKHTTSPKHSSSVSSERSKKHLDSRKRNRSQEDDSRSSPYKMYGKDRGSSKPLKDESRRDKKSTDRSRDHRRDKVGKCRNERRDSVNRSRDERTRGRSKLSDSDKKDVSKSNKNSINDATQKERDKRNSLDEKSEPKNETKDQKNDGVESKKRQQSSSSVDKKDRSADSKSQDRRDRLKSADDSQRKERHQKSSVDEKNESVDDKSKSLDEKYPWMSIDCPIDNRKMVRGNNRLLEEEKFPWNSIDCFGDQQTKEKEKEPSIPLDEKYPWYGIECPADEAGTGKHESGNSVDEKYPWNSIDCSVDDSSPTKVSKNLDEKYPWNSVDCSTVKPNPSLFDCSFCQESFVKQAELNEHMDDIHENEDTYRCSLCKNVRYKVALRLSSHMRVHHQMYNNMVFKDYLEGGIRTFRVREQHLTDELRELQKSVIGTDVWDTDSLEINRSNRNSVEKVEDDNANAEEDKGDNGLRTCSFCMGEESFTTKSKLNSHMNNAHKDVDNLRCCLCDNTFRIVGRLREHLMEQHEIRPQMVYMEFLENGWRTLKVKGKFAHAVKTEMQTRSPCPEKDDLSDPDQPAEDNDMEKNMSRDEAGDRINRKHARDPDAIPQKRFRCRYCPVDEFFPRKKLLIQHYRSAHNNNKRKHIKPDEDHNQAVPYDCAVCKEQFKSRGDLDTHTTTCSGSKKSSQWSVFF